VNKQKIDGFVTHLHPHADEEFALLLLADYGNEVYHFTRNCNVQYVAGYLDPADFTVYGRTILRLGVGGGYCDDHGRGEDRRACCQLVAAHLDVADRPELIKLIEVVARLDKELSKTRAMTLPRLIKMAYRYGKKPEQVRAWTRCAFDALIAKEKEFFEVVRSDNDWIRDREKRSEAIGEQFLKEERPWDGMVIETIAPLIPQKDRRDWLDFVREVADCQRQAFAQAVKYAGVNAKRYYSGTFDRHFKVLFTDASDSSSQMHLELDPACRTTDLQIDFLILRNPHGNTMIVANKSAHADLRMFVACLRRKEASRRGKSISDAEVLTEGTIPGHEHWHLHEGTETPRVYNGTETRPDIEKSALSFNEITQAFTDALLLEDVCDAKPRTAAA
jgi:hypothetical protein